MNTSGSHCSTPPWDDHRLGWLALAWFDNFSAKTLRKLRARYPQGDHAFRVRGEELLSFGISKKTVHAFLSWRNSIELEMLARRCEAEQIRFVLEEDSEFPSFLKHSSDPPAALFLRGAPLKLMRPIAVVGTRSMTNYGARVTENLCRDLVSSGCEIISGLAFGVDAKAHEATLDAHGVTVAVLAGGCNDTAITPRSNMYLARRIIEQRGTVLSEFPPGTESMRYLFPLRNRIIASLSVATVVVEAAESSGSLITAKLALEENRDVFVVPGPITSEQSAGTNHLLIVGAAPCLGAHSILALFEADPHLSTPETVEATDEERALLRILDQPLHVDDLIRELARPPNIVVSLASTLEIKGFIEHQGGNMYTRTTRGRIASGLT